ncbi:MAG: hypothetical protein ABII12_00605 [Planctomycetota bacterium]
MLHPKKCFAVVGSCVVCSVLVVAACTQSLSSLSLPGQEGLEGSKVSEGRLNADRVLEKQTMVYVDLLQYEPGSADLRCYPLGSTVPGSPAWKSRINGPVPLTSDYTKSEYDVLARKGETDYVLSVRISKPSNDPHFSHVEFNLRAVNPKMIDHLAHFPGDPDYHKGEADYPSNDTVEDNRSLIDLNGGDIAVVIRGLEFKNLVNKTNPHTSAWMNVLGSSAWVAFMRDNALNSGRFFAIEGALTGGPVALVDDPPVLGMFESVQVRGDTFDDLSENPTLLDGGDPGNLRVCSEVDAPDSPSTDYALLDYSNIDAVGALAPGRGGFIFVMRDSAFSNKVVVDASVNPGNPPAGGNKIDAPPSGYDGTLIPEIDPALATTNPVTGAPGAHELAVSVFFIHTWD